MTLSGTIQRDLQRRPALRAAQGVDGVRQVVDQLKVEAKKAWTPRKPVEKLSPPANTEAEKTEETPGEDSLPATFPDETTRPQAWTP